MFPYLSFVTFVCQSPDRHKNKLKPEEIIPVKTLLSQWCILLLEFVRGAMKGGKQEEERTGCLLQFRWPNKKMRGHKKIQKEDDKTKLLLPKKKGRRRGDKDEGFV